MPQRRDSLVAGSYYHLYNRGVNHELIFFQPENWDYFLRQIKLYFHQHLVAILAYCLMPNHYHLLVQLLTDNFSESIMQPFSLSYTKAINKQQRRVGPLFQGRIQSAWIDSTSYLLHLSRYIHLNPVRANLVETPADWVYSSYRDYIGMRIGKIPHKEMIMSSFQGPESYQEFVEAGDLVGEKEISHLLLD